MYLPLFVSFCFFVLLISSTSLHHVFVEAADHVCADGYLYLRDRALGTATFSSVDRCDLVIKNCTADSLKFTVAVTASNITIDGLICSTRTTAILACIDFPLTVDAGNLTFSRVSADAAATVASGSFFLLSFGDSVKVNSSFTVQHCSLTGTFSSPASALQPALAYIGSRLEASSAALPYTSEVVLRNNSMRGFTATNAASLIHMYGFYFRDLQFFAHFTLEGLDMGNLDLSSSNNYIRLCGVMFFTTFTMSSSSPHQGGIFRVSGVKIGGTLKYAKKDSTSYGVSVVDFVGVASGVHSLSVSDCSVSLSSLEATGNPMALAFILRFKPSTILTNIDTLSLKGNKIEGHLSSGADHRAIICSVNQYTNVSLLEFYNNEIDLIAGSTNSGKSITAVVFDFLVASTGSGKEESGLILRNNRVGGSYFFPGGGGNVILGVLQCVPFSDHNFFISENNMMENLHVHGGNPFVRLHKANRIDLLGLPSSTISLKNDGFKNVTVKSAASKKIYAYCFAVEGSVSGVSNFSVSGLDMSSSRNSFKANFAAVRYIGIFLEGTFAMSSSSSSSSSNQGGIFSVSGIKLGGRVKYNDKDTTTSGVAAVFFVDRVVGVSSLSISDSSISLSRIEVSGRDVDLQVSLVRFAFQRSGVSNIDTVSAKRCSITGPAFVTSGTDSGDTRISVFRFEWYQSVAHVILLDNVIDVIASNPFGHIYAVMLYSRAFAKGSSSVASSGLFFHRNTMSGSYFVTGFQKQLFVELLHVLLVNSINTIESRNNKFVNIHGVGEDNVKIHFFGFTSAVTLRGLPNSTISSSGDSGRNITAKSPSLSTYFHLFLFSSVSGVSNFSVTNFDCSDSRNYFESSTSYVRFMVIIILSTFTMSSSSPHQGGIFRVSGVKLGGTLKYDKKDASTYGVSVIDFLFSTFGIYSISVSTCTVDLSRLEASGTGVEARAGILRSFSIADIDSISVTNNSIKAGHFTSTGGVRVIIWAINKYRNLSHLVLTGNSLDAIASSPSGLEFYSLILYVKASSTGNSDSSTSGLVFRRNRVSGSYFSGNVGAVVGISFFLGTVGSHNTFTSENNQVENIYVSAGKLLYVLTHYFKNNFELGGVRSSTVSSVNNSLRNITVKSTATVNVHHLLFGSHVSLVSVFTVSDLDMSSSLNYIESTASNVRYVAIFFFSSCSMTASSSSSSSSSSSGGVVDVGGIFSVTRVRIGGTLKYSDDSANTFGVSVLQIFGQPAGNIHSVSVSDSSISLSRLEVTGDDAEALAYILKFENSQGIKDINIISVRNNSIKGHYLSALSFTEVTICRLQKYTNVSRLIFSDNTIDVLASCGDQQLYSFIFIVVSASTGSGTEESALIFKNNRISGNYFGSGTATKVFVRIAGVTSLSSLNSVISENNKLSDIHAVAVDVVNVQMHAISVFLQLLDLPSSNISSTDDSLTNITVKSVTKSVEVHCFNLENIGGITQFSITRLNISNCKLDAGGESSSASLSALALDVLAGSGIKKFEFENNDMLEMEKSEVISSSQDARRNFVFFASDVVVAGANFSFLENKFSTKLPVIEFDSGAQLVKGSTTGAKNFFYFKDNSLPRQDPNVSNLLRFSDVNTARQQLTSAARFSFDCNEWARGLQKAFIDTTRWNGAQLEASSACFSPSATRSRSANLTETESLSNSSSISMSQTISETELTETDSESDGNFTATRGTFSETETVTPTPSLTHSRSPDPPQFFRSESLLNGVAADIATTISVLSMNSQGGVGLARARRVSRMSEGCDVQKKRQNPDWAGSPLQMHFGENDDLASIRGLLIGNSIFVFAFAASMYFIARVLVELIDKPFEKCQRICRLPGVLAILWMVLVSDTAASVMVILTFSPRAKKDIIAVAVGAIFVLVLPCCLWVYVLMEINYQKTKRGYGMEFVVEQEDEKPEKPSHLTSRSHHRSHRETEEQRRQRKREEKTAEAEYKKKLKEYEARMKEKQACSSVAARWFKWFMDPTVPGKEWTDTCFVQAWGLFFDMYDESSWFALFDFLVSALSGFFEGYTDGEAPASRCVSMSVCNLLLFSIHFLLLLYFWPFLSRYDKLCSFLNSMLAIIMSALSLTSHLGNEAGDHGLEISEVIALVISLFSLLCLVDIIKCFVELYRVLTNKEQVEQENQSMSEFGSQLREQLISPSSSSSRSPRSRFNDNNNNNHGEEEEDEEMLLSPRHHHQQRRRASSPPVEIVSPRSRPSSSPRSQPSSPRASIETGRRRNNDYNNTNNSATAAASGGGEGTPRSRRENSRHRSPRRNSQRHSTSSQRQSNY